jgi:ABC-2 type transport system permease protein
VTDDVKTVVWKERRLLFSQRGGRTQLILTLLVPAALFAVVMPWQEGRGYFDSPVVIMAGIFIPMLIVMLTIPESIAGERERHTLETLLASRLSGRNILFGKLIVSIGLALLISLVAFVVGFVVANATDWTGQLVFYSRMIAVASITLSVLVASLSASAGVLISLKAATVREAQQKLMAAVMFPVLLLGIAGTFVFTIEAIRDKITGIIDRIDPIVLFLVVVVILIAASCFLMRAAIKRFQRARLTLD